MTGACSSPAVSCCDGQQSRKCDIAPHLQPGANGVPNGIGSVPFSIPQLISGVPFSIQSVVSPFPFPVVSPFPFPSRNRNGRHFETRDINRLDEVLDNAELRFELVEVFIYEDVFAAFLPHLPSWCGTVHDQLGGRNRGESGIGD